MSEEQQESVILGPGQILKNARTQANLSIQDIAKKVRLKKDLLEDIERDSYDINISLTFIRGYLKLYAKHVNVAEEEVIAAFDKLNTQKKEPVKLQSFSRRVANQANDDKLMLVTYVLVGLVVALVVIWWLQKSNANTDEVVVLLPASQPSETVAVTPAQPALVPSPPSIEIINSDTSQDTPVLLTVQSAAEALSSEPADASQQVSSGDNSITGTAPDTAKIISAVSEPTTVDVNRARLIESSQPIELIFEFAGDCWMNLSDATGENIAYGVKVSGRVMPVTGYPPFVVTLGAPEVVKISYAGQAVDMSFLKPGRIAKFDLPLSE
jgi:cytoskeleton protein RodZ